MINRYSARTEVRTKSEPAIERETAEKWAARAIACYENYAKTKKRSWLLRADQYRSEALEHGAMVEDCGKTACRMQRLMDKSLKDLGIKRRGK